MEKVNEKTGEIEIETLLTNLPSEIMGKKENRRDLWCEMGNWMHLQNIKT